MKRKLMSMIVALLPALIVFMIVASSSTPTQAAPAAAGGIKISQVYGGGGNTSAPAALYKRDFIELFNQGSTTVDVTGWRVWYSSATGSFSSTLITILTGTIAPGQYYLIAESQGSGGTQDLPTPNVTGTLAMAAGAGKVALVQDSTNFNAIACPSSSSIVDFVGYGSTANCYEGAGPTPTLNNNTSAVRKGDGCADTDSNSADFSTILPPTPRNSNSPVNLCGLKIVKSAPAAVGIGVAYTYTIVAANTGVTTTNGVITDALPLSVTLVPASISDGGVLLSGNVISWSVSTVPYLTSITRTFMVTAPASAATVINADYQIYADSSLTPTLGAPVTTQVGSPDLAASKSILNGAINVGDFVTFTIVYSNSGALGATGVILADQLPSAVSYVTDSLGTAVITGNGKFISWTIGSLASSATGTITLTAQANYAGSYQNHIAIRGNEADSNPLDNSFDLPLIIQGAQSYVSKSGPDVLISGDVVSYTITYGNKGNQLTGVVTVTDNLPAGFQVSDIVGDNSGLNIVSDSGSIRVWTTTVAAGSASVFTLALTVPNSATIASGTLVTNTVQVTSLDPGNDPSDDTASASSTVYEVVPIAVARAGSTGQVFAIQGQVINLPGVYSAQEWELQDNTGGIVIFYSPAPTLTLGDYVRLVAPRGVYASQQEMLTPTYYINLGHGVPPAPRLYTTGQVAAGSAQGWLVTISGTLSALTNCSGNYHLSVNDGSGATDIYINAYSNPVINPCGRGFTNGDWVQITGFSTVNVSTYQVRPRMASDLVQYPRVLNVGPVAGATDVALSANITATFNVTMTNVDTTTFLLQGPSGAVDGSVVYNGASKTATLTPSANLAAGTKYTVTLKSNLQASNGLSFYPAQDYVWTFTTHQTAPNLSTSALASPGQVVYGGSLVTYTFTLINTGDANATTTVTDVLPGYYAVGNLLNFTQPTTGTLTWTGVVTAGQTVNVQFVARVKLTGLSTGLNLLFNSATMNDGLRPELTLDDPTPPLITVYGLYLPLIKR